MEDNLENQTASMTHAYIFVKNGLMDESDCNFFKTLMSRIADFKILQSTLKVMRDFGEKKCIFQF